MCRFSGRRREIVTLNLSTPVATPISTRGIAWAREHGHHMQRSPEAFLLLLLASHFDDAGETSLSIADLADLTRLTPGVITKALKETWLFDLIKCELTGTLRAPNRFKAVHGWDPADTGGAPAEGGSRT
jgi:hypothetical protein